MPEATENTPDSSLLEQTAADMSDEFVEHCSYDTVVGMVAKRTRRYVDSASGRVAHVPRVHSLFPHGTVKLNYRGSKSDKV